MSSFNINGPSNKPQVTEAQNMMNNGGGGNTGYLQSRGKKKKKGEETIDPAILEGEIEDKFERTEEEYEDDDDYYYNASLQNIPKSDDTFEKNNEQKPKNTAKGIFFGLIDKVTDKIAEKNIKKDDDNPGGDFLSLSGKDI